MRIRSERRSDRGSRFVNLSCAFSCLFAVACGDSGDEEPGGSAGVEVRAAVSPTVTTVVTVTWTTPEPDTGHVEYGLTPDLGLATPVTASAASEQSQLLLGLTSDTLYYYRVVTASGATSKVMSIRTGYLPVGVPTIEVVGDGHSGFVATTSLGTNNAAMVLNPQGQIVWYLRDESGLQVVRSRLSRDRKSILYNTVRVSGEPSADSKLVRVSLDGSQISSVVVPYLAHDFVELPDGTIAALVVKFEDSGGVQIKSNAIVEVTPAGTITEAWSALDCFDPAVHMSSEPEQGWTLANSVDYDETDNVYYFGSRGLSSIARIRRGARACEWVLGSMGNTLAFAAGSATFLHQHQFQVLGDRILVHDNDGAMTRQSRVVEYQLDLAAGTATEVWSFTSTPAVYVPVLGEALRLEGGDTFIDWSYAGQLERVTPTGETTWKLNTQVGGALGYATLLDTFY